MAGRVLLLIGLAASLLAMLRDKSVELLSKDADLLYIPAFFQDLWHHGGVAEWRLPPAGYFFPDMLLYGLANLVLPDFRAAILLTAVLQILLLLGGAALLCRRSPMGGAAALFLLLAIYIRLAGSINAQSQEIWLGAMATTGVHFGVVLGAVWSTWLAVESRSKPWALIALGGVSAAMLASDSFFAIWYCGPAAVALSLERQWRPAALLVLLSLIAAVLQSQLNPVLGGYSGALTPTRVWVALRDEFSWYGLYDRQAPLRVAFLALPLIVCAILARRHLTARIAALSGLAALLSSGALGLFVDYTSMRYATIALLLPLSVLGALVGDGLTLRRPAAFGLVALVAVALSGRLDRPLAPPAVLSCLPAGNAAGLADYWQARPLTLYSDERLQVEPLQPNAHLTWWIANRRWFTESLANPGRRPDFSFIMMRGVNEADALSLYGEPARKEDCGGGIWFYDHALTPTE